VKETYYFTDWYYFKYYVITSNTTHFKTNTKIINVINNFNNTFPNINWKHASTYEVGMIIESLKSKQSCGYDEIPVKIVKLSALFITRTTITSHKILVLL
jgi:hypothetical protein